VDLRDRQQLAPGAGRLRNQWCQTLLCCDCPVPFWLACMRIVAMHAHCGSRQTLTESSYVKQQWCVIQDLLELERRTGDGRVHLQLTFKRGLHPFFPTAVQVCTFFAAPPQRVKAHAAMAARAKVGSLLTRGQLCHSNSRNFTQHMLAFAAQVVSPRFQGPLAGALASHPMLQLQNWDPWRHIKELVLHLRTFLEVHLLCEFASAPLLRFCIQHGCSDGLCSYAEYSLVRRHLGHNTLTTHTADYDLAGPLNRVQLHGEMCNVECTHYMPAMDAHSGATRADEDSHACQNCAIFGGNSWRP